MACCCSCGLGTEENRSRRGLGNDGLCFVVTLQVGFCYLRGLGVGLCSAWAEPVKERSTTIKLSELCRLSEFSVWGQKGARVWMNFCKLIVCTG